MLNTTLIAAALLCSVILLSKRVRDNQSWRATVTPLASIIGSGFLVIVPLLGNAVGGYAPLAMAGVVLLAYGVGSAIRFNINYIEPILEAGSSSVITRLDYLSDLALGLSYFISVTFYLRLLASFALRGFDVESELVAQIITTGILAFIGISGWLYGLSFLERLEEYSVSIKLSIIAALLLGWAVHDVSQVTTFHLTSVLPTDLNGWHVIRLLAGVLIVVQGFETSRYLGGEYDAPLRIKTMRRAQIISGLIYLVFVLLTVPSFGLLSAEVSDTAIIDLSKTVASALPYMLVIAAIMSQLSAAVADTVGVGGLFAQTIGKRLKLPARTGYIMVAVVGVILVWTADIFEVIALASRAFALYYAIQSLEAAIEAKRSVSIFKAAAFGVLAILLLISAVIAIPAG